MPLLAEISDKMWTVHDLFVHALVVAFFSNIWGIIRWWLALPSILFLCLLNLSLYGHMNGLWEAIIYELGGSWLIGSFAACNGPFVMCWIGLFLYRKHRQRSSRQKDGLCTVCGYNLTGNVSGVCTECGTAIPTISGK